jgi:two-component system chemotaxis sensor kinase CheA
MIVGVGGQRFGIPVDIVQETVRVPSRSVQRIKGSEAIILRDRLVPLVSLHSLLDSPPPSPSQDLAVLVVRIDGEPLGLTVDRFHDNLDVIVKPLKGVVAACHGFAGTAMLGDGDVLLVINTKEMLHANREIVHAA